MTDIRVADPLVGTLVDGRYRVRERVARGDVATVYTATDERLERTVVLKMVHPSQPDPRFLERFIEDARAAAGLTHPNVVAAYDQGTHQGLPYLVMQYVPGRTLRDVLSSRGRLAPPEALAITEQVLAAIAAAHRIGLVHRDVRPENVLVAEAPSGGIGDLVDSVVKVADFGLGPAIGGAGPGRGGPVTPYTPPEGRDGRPDPRGDVYAVGVLLYEMLTGQAPVRDHWSAAGTVPRPSGVVPGLPVALDDLVAWATRPEPAARPSDAGTLLAEVQAARERLATTAPPPPSADTTMLLTPVAAPERPAWARLPAQKSRPPGRVVRSGQGRSRPGHSATTDPAASRRRLAVIAAVVVAGLLLAAGGWWVGIGRYVPAPDLVGMPRAEAVAKAEERGLRVTFTEPRHSDDVPLEHVLAQDPTDRVTRGGTLVLTLSLGPEQVLVPDVIGVDLDVAVRQLEALGLSVVEGERGYSDTIPQGRVLGVSPEVGTEVAPGEQVTITVSEGRAPIDVPSVIGDPLPVATQKLQGLGLAVTTERVESDRPRDEVLAQDPVAGAGAEPGATVHLQVSEGPPTQPVPGVTGARCQQAAEALSQAGFNPSIQGRERGRVVLQVPSEGTGLPPGSEVQIWCA